MKKKFLMIIVAFCFSFTTAHVKAQQEEIEQLILNIEKLNQLRAILDNMYKGYKILTDGYNTIKYLAEGNFNLHKFFLDGLLAVSPTINNYNKIADIITYQRQLIKEYKSAFGRFRSVDAFSPDELDYLGKVYSSLINRSLKNLDELAMVVTSGQLRMNDAERLSAIDRIYLDMQDKIQFLRHFNDKTTLIAAQRLKNKNEIEDLRALYGIKN